MLGTKMLQTVLSLNFLFLCRCILFQFAIKRKLTTFKNTSMSSYILAKAQILRCHDKLWIQSSLYIKIRHYLVLQKDVYNVKFIIRICRGLFWRIVNPELHFFLSFDSLLHMVCPDYCKSSSCYLDTVKIHIHHLLWPCVKQLTLIVF